MDFFEYIRSKDAGTKTRFSLFVASGITFLIMIVWASTFSTRLAPISLSGSEAEKIADESRGINDIIGDAKKQLGTLMSAKEELTNSIEKGNENEAPEVEEFDANSALGTLIISENGTSTEITTAHEPAREEVGHVATTTPRNSTSTPGEPKVPRVILIGTTTSETVE